MGSRRFPERGGGDGVWTEGCFRPGWWSNMFVVLLEFSVDFAESGILPLFYFI